MRVTVDPPLNRWKLGAGERRSGDRAWMGPANDRPIIATGHQAWLWHPGILAKDIAAVEAGRQLGAQVVHLVVDHDTQDAMTLDLPVVCGEPGSERLDVATVELGHVQTGVPTGMQPPFNANAMAKRIGDAVQRIGANGGHIAVDSQPILSAMEATDGVATLAEQMTSVIVQLMPPIVGDVAFVNSSDMLDNDVGRALVQRMLEDAQCCVARFNDAVTTHHDAGVRALRVERERVELPLWHIAWEQPRQRVFADVSDSKPLLVNEAGEVLELADDHAKLAPRALLLSAMMRTWYCDLFIHGKSGG
ncbi:MAG: hypothetical protein MJA84_02935, partial [Firmicutes bacterium]|nr:hypothetical protein [Bacillota bacterium]